MSIIQDEWCWKHKSLEVEVLDSDASGVELRQIGYILRCSLSHAITLVSMLFLVLLLMCHKYYSTPNFVFFSPSFQEFFQDGSKPENVGVYNLSKGVNRFCLSKPGEGLSADLSLAKHSLN